MPHKLDKGKTRLRDRVSASQPMLPRLPLVHSTDSFTLADILDQGQLVPQDCSIFGGEALTYFFYGRPDFRPNLDQQANALQHYLPVCLIFRPDWVCSVKRIFPFDSGAFQNGFFSAFCHKSMKIGDFLLEADVSTPGKIVREFYGSNYSYLEGLPKLKPKTDASEFEAQSLVALINAAGSNSADSRGAGVEVQTSDVIEISNAVRAVVLPSTFLDGLIGGRLAGFGIDLLPYNLHGRLRPDEYTSEIMQICRGYYHRVGLADLDVS